MNRSSRRPRATARSARSRQPAGGVGDRAHASAPTSRRIAPRSSTAAAGRGRREPRDRSRPRAGSCRAHAPDATRRRAAGETPNGTEARTPGDRGRVEHVEVDVRRTPRVAPVARRPRRATSGVDRGRRPGCIDAERGRSRRSPAASRSRTPTSTSRSVATDAGGERQCRRRPRRGSRAAPSR